MKIKRKTKHDRRIECRRTRQHGTDYQLVVAKHFFSLGTRMGSVITKRAVKKTMMDFPFFLPDIIKKALSQLHLKLVPEAFGWRENWDETPISDQECSLCVCWTWLETPSDGIPIGKCINSRIASKTRACDSCSDFQPHPHIKKIFS